MDCFASLAMTPAPNQLAAAAGTSRLALHDDFVERAQIGPWHEAATKVSGSGRLGRSSSGLHAPAAPTFGLRVGASVTRWT